MYGVGVRIGGRLAVTVRVRVRVSVGMNETVCWRRRVAAVYE